MRGERPLWDFPDGTLAGREVAAYLVSAATGWDLVPPTVLRDGPLGPGACQLWIDEPEDAEPLVGFVPADELPPGWFPIAAARGRRRRRVPAGPRRRPAAGPAGGASTRWSTTPTARAGTCSYAADGPVYGVDHGVCFHVEDKLRTVLWGWAGRPLPAGRRGGARRGCAGQLAGALGDGAGRAPDLGEVAAAGGPGRPAAARPARFPQPPEDWPADALAAHVSRCHR